MELGFSVSEFWDDLTVAELALYAKRNTEARIGYWAGYFSRIEKLRTDPNYYFDPKPPVDGRMTPEEQDGFYERARRMERELKERRNA